MSEKKTGLCEIVSKFMESHVSDNNKTFQKLKEAMEENERLRRELEAMTKPKKQDVWAGCYPREVAEAALNLVTAMNKHQVSGVHLFGMVAFK